MCLSGNIPLDLCRQRLREAFDDHMLINRKKRFKLALKIKLSGFDNIENLSLQFFIPDKFILKDHPAAITSYAKLPRPWYPPGLPLFPPALS